MSDEWYTTNDKPVVGFNSKVKVVYRNKNGEELKSPWSQKSSEVVVHLESDEEAPASPIYDSNDPHYEPWTPPSPTYNPVSPTYQPSDSSDEGDTSDDDDSSDDDSSSDSSDSSSDDDDCSIISINSIITISDDDEMDVDEPIIISSDDEDDIIVQGCDNWETFRQRFIQQQLYYGNIRTELN